MEQGRNPAKHQTTTSWKMEIRMNPKNPGEHLNLTALVNELLFLQRPQNNDHIYTSTYS